MEDKFMDLLACKRGQQYNKSRIALWQTFKFVFPYRMNKKIKKTAIIIYPHSWYFIAFPRYFLLVKSHNTCRLVSFGIEPIIKQSKPLLTMWAKDYFQVNNVIHIQIFFISLFFIKKA